MQCVSSYLIKNVFRSNRTEFANVTPSSSQSDTVLCNLIILERRTKCSAVFARRSTNYMSSMVKAGVREVKAAVL